MTVLVRLGAVESRRFGFELVKPSSTAVTGAGSSATISALGSVEFSSCESLSLNGVFSSGYDNYMLVFTSKGSTANFPQIRLRASGVDESSASNFYVNQFVSVQNTLTNANRSSLSFWYSTGTDTTLWAGTAAYIYGPHLAQPTAYRSLNADPRGSATVSDYAGTHSQSTSYDGLTLYPNSGSISGRVAVYGMRG